MTDDTPIHRLERDGRTITLIGTAHVSQESADLVRRTIETEQPDTVCIELCESRLQSVRQKSRWQEMDIIKVVKEKKAFLLLSNLILASFQKRIADRMDIKPGQEMITAVEAAEAAGAQVWLADRDIRVTLSRTWRSMGLWDKLKLLYQLLLSLGEVDDLSQEDIERMKQEDVLNALLEEIGTAQPVIREILIDERDRYLAQKIKDAPGAHIVAVVGAGHVPGIKRYWSSETDLAALEALPPKSRLAGLIKWGLPAAILGLFVYGFYAGGSKAGSDMILWWVAANGLLAQEEPAADAIVVASTPAAITPTAAAEPAEGDTAASDEEADGNAGEEAQPEEETLPAPTEAPTQAPLPPTAPPPPTGAPTPEPTATATSTPQVVASFTPPPTPFATELAPKAARPASISSFRSASRPTGPATSCSACRSVRRALMPSSCIS